MSWKSKGSRENTGEEKNGGGTSQVELIERLGQKGKLKKWGKDIRRYRANKNIMEESHSEKKLKMGEKE